MKKAEIYVSNQLAGILIEDENGMNIIGVGLVWHGGTEESVEMVDNKVNSCPLYKLCAVSFL